MPAVAQGLEGNGLRAQKGAGTTTLSSAVRLYIVFNGRCPDTWCRHPEQYLLPSCSAGIASLIRLHLHLGTAALSFKGATALPPQVDPGLGQDFNSMPGFGWSQASVLLCVVLSKA